MINKYNIIKENQRKTLYDPNLAEYLNKKIEEEKRRKELGKSIEETKEKVEDNPEKKMENMGKIVGLREVWRERHPEEIMGVSFSPDGRYIGIGYLDWCLRIFEIIREE